MLALHCEDHYRLCMFELHGNTHELGLCNRKIEKPTFIKHPLCIFQTLNVDKIVSMQSCLKVHRVVSFPIYFPVLLNLYDFFTLFLSLPLMIIV